MITGVGIFLGGYAFALLIGQGVRVMVARAAALHSPAEQQTLDDYEDIMVRRNLAQYQADLYQLHMVARHEANWRSKVTLAGQGVADALESGNEAQKKAALAYWSETVGTPPLTDPLPESGGNGGD